MKAKLAAFGWQIVEYLRRMVTPFIINLLYGMTMLAASSIQEDAIRIILVLVLLGATGFTDFIFMRGAGEIAYKMRVVGERKRANLPVSQDSRIGVYRKSKEYAAYRGFVIGLFICILPILCIVIGAAAGADVCRTILMFTAGWAYIPVFVFQIAGKSGGEYYTPQEVSELLTRLTLVGKTEVNKVYDPACGSGSLLLKFAKILGRDKVRQGFFGQESNITTYNLCRINMFLHDISYNKFDIHCGDTLTAPCHWDDEPFDAIVSNPPYSTRWEGSDNPTLINDPRFAPAGVLAPKTKSDLAFTMHMLSWLSTDGTAAIVEFPGVLYRGGAEQKIRKYLVDNNYVDTVIQLPQNLFFGVTIATCIIVLSKHKRENKTLFIDASAEFVHEGNKNKLSPDNIVHIVDEYTNHKIVPHFSALVDNAAIAENDYNLSVSSYVEAEDTRPQTDIKELNDRIRRIVAHENELRAEIDKIIVDLEQEDAA